MARKRIGRLSDYPREDKCAKCGEHIGWVIDSDGECFALGDCGKHTGIGAQFIQDLVCAYSLVVQASGATPEEALEALPMVQHELEKNFRMKEPNVVIMTDNKDMAVSGE